MRLVFSILGTALILIIGGSVYFFTQGVGDTQNDVLSESAADVPLKETIVYTDEGFTPKTVTIAKGGEVEFVNRSSMPLWVASNPHPEHTDYPEFDTLKINGDSMPGMKDDTKFTFQRTGSWEFHNHTASGDATDVAVHPGTIIVK